MGHPIGYEPSIPLRHRLHRVALGVLITGALLFHIAVFPSRDLALVHRGFFFIEWPENRERSVR